MEQDELINNHRTMLLNLLSISATLAGLCITIVALMSSIDKAKTDIMIVDDILAACAAAFVICIYLTFWAMRTSIYKIMLVLIKLIDAVFLIALTGMTVAAFLLTYTIW